MVIHFGAQSKYNNKKGWEGCWAMSQRALCFKNQPKHGGLCRSDMVVTVTTCGYHTIVRHTYPQVNYRPYTTSMLDIYYYNLDLDGWLEHSIRVVNPSSTAVWTKLNQSKWSKLAQIILDVTRTWDASTEVQVEEETHNHISFSIF